LSEGFGKINRNLRGGDNSLSEQMSSATKWQSFGEPSLRVSNIHSKGTPHVSLAQTEKVNYTSPLHYVPGANKQSGGGVLKEGAGCGSP